jgi:hypothetical protein
LLLVFSAPDMADVTGAAKAAALDVEAKTLLPLIGFASARLADGFNRNLMLTLSVQINMNRSMSRCYLYRGPQSVRAPAYQYEPTTPE